MDNNKLIIGNMKMNLTLKEVKEYIKQIEPDKNFYVCPPSIYLSYFNDLGYNTGIQNVSEFDMGAYTGEISAIQAVSMGVDLVIVGHSERRMYLYETDEIINNKVKKSLLSGMDVVLCIGETFEEKEQNKTKDKLNRQLIEDLKNLYKEDIKHVIIAYEPIWAIGTGKIPTNEEISDISNFIKNTVNKIYGLKPKVLYGGSINENNIEELNKINSIDGFLIGGACLKPNKFKKIIETVDKK